MFNKLELKNAMIKVLEEAIENKYPDRSICFLPVIIFSSVFDGLTFNTAWRELFDECLSNTFDKLEYISTQYPIEGCEDDCDEESYAYSEWKVQKESKTFWTHPEYGPKRIKLANQLLEILNNHETEEEKETKEKKD